MSEPEERASFRPTQAMLAERDRRYSAPMTITARVNGDPPPGYSALDQRAR